MDGVDTILNLMKRLPGSNAFHLSRLGHTLEHGHLLILKEEGAIKGYAELFRMRHIPNYPVRPLPKDDPSGEYIYCFSAVAERGYILKLIQLCKKTFPKCTYIVWHRERRNRKLHLERIEHD